MAPSLKIGATLAIFQLSGNRPRERDKLNSCTREGANTEIPTFKKELDIQSTPDPLEVLIPPQTLIKVSSLIGENMKGSQLGGSPNSPLRRGLGLGAIFSAKLFPTLQKKLYSISNGFVVSNGFITFFESLNVHGF